MADEGNLLDRAAELRDEDGVLDRLRTEPGTRVVVVREGRLRLDGEAGVVLRVPVEAVGEAEWALLGRDDDGTAVLVAAVAAESDSIDVAPEETWFGLRDAGGRLDEREFELFVTAIAVAGWLQGARFCSFCGTELQLRQAGWSRRCPSCGRDNVGVWNLAEAVEDRLKSYPQAFEVAVMGCAVNGPGEAGDADFGIAGGRDTGFIYAHGRVLKKVSSDILVDELFHEIDTWIEGGMERPKRLKLAKPAALLMAEAAQRPS